MATPNQFVIREVGLATLYNLSTGKPYVYLQNLKTSGVENSAEVNYATGGRGNARIVGFSSGRTAKITLEDAVFGSEALAMMTGNGVATGAEEIWRRDELTVASDACTLTKTPVGSLIGLYELESDGSNGTELTYAATPATGEYGISAKVISLYSTDYADGAKLVAYYKMNTDATAKTITISSDKFAGAFRLVLDCLVKDTVLKTDFQAQLIAYNCQMENAWSVTMSSSGDPSTFSMPIEILKPTSGTTMWELIVFDDTLAT